MVDIQGFEGRYAVCEDGRIWSHLRNKFLKPVAHHSHGGDRKYRKVSLHKNGRKTYLVHRLVAQALIPNPENYPEVNHKDGNHSNNHPSNLEWCTTSYNIDHAFQIGTRKRVMA